MATYNIEFWRGAERIFEYEGDDYPNLDDAQHVVAPYRPDRASWVDRAMNSRGER